MLKYVHSVYTSQSTCIHQFSSGRTSGYCFLLSANSFISLHEMSSSIISEGVWFEVRCCSMTSRKFSGN